MVEPSGHHNEPTTFFPVDLESIGSTLEALDLYLKHESTERPTLYCARGVALCPSDRERLIKQGVRYLLVPYEQHGEYRDIVLQELQLTYDDASLPGTERRRRVRGACEKFIRDALSSPARPGDITLVTQLADRLADWLASDADEMLDMIDMSRHDFQTAAHMLNVGLGCAMLMTRIAPGDARQIRLALEGGLLHDLGKRSLDESLLNKQGSLSPVEWESVRRHPIIGHDELAKRDGVAPQVLEMVRDHHERLDGGGYPNGIAGDQIGLFARICAIVDVFDAVSSARPYRKPMHPFDALDVMREGVGAHFDAMLFEVWIAIVHEGVRQSGGEGLPERVGEDGVTLNLSKLLQWGPEGMAPPMSGARRNRARNHNDDRRVNTRKAWRSAIPTTILTHNKLNDGQLLTRSMTLRSVDISVGGIQLVTPNAFTQGDLLLLQLPGRDGKPIIRHGRVVRVRKDEKGQWIAGVEFVAPELAAEEDQSDESAPPASAQGETRSEAA